MNTASGFARGWADRRSRGPSGPSGPVAQQPGAGDIALDGVTKVYGSGATAVRALDRVDMNIAQGVFVAVMGPSGSGKTTLLQMMAGLDMPTEGRVFVGGAEVSAMSESELNELRRHRIGFVFQAHNLLPTLTAQENILLPLVIAGDQPDPEWFNQVVGAVGMADRLDHWPGQLSLGQQQRVAVARALIARPTVVLADEPTGNLDSRASGELLAFLAETMAMFDQTVVMATHDHLAAAYAQRIISLSDGCVVDDAVRAPGTQE